MDGLVNLTLPALTSGSVSQITLDSKHRNGVRIRVLGYFSGRGRTEGRSIDRCSSRNIGSGGLFYWLTDRTLVNSLVLKLVLDKQPQIIVRRQRLRKSIRCVLRDFIVAVYPSAPKLYRQLLQFSIVSNTGDITGWRKRNGFGSHT